MEMMPLINSGCSVWKCSHSVFSTGNGGGSSLCSYLPDECMSAGAAELKCLFVFDQDSSSVMEWDQCLGDKSQQLLETQQSYETEWDMVNTVSFKKRPCTNSEGEF